MYQQQGRSAHEESLVVPSSPRLSPTDHLPTPRVRAIRARSATAIVSLLLLLRREPAPISRPFKTRHHRQIARARVRVPLSNAAGKIARVAPVAVIRSSGGLGASLSWLPIRSSFAVAGRCGERRSRMGVTERDADADRVRPREGRAQRRIGGRGARDTTAGVDRRCTGG